MTTAQEIEIKIAATEKVLRRLSHRLEIEQRDLIVYGMHVAVGRKVCARRARKLRQRGDDVRYSSRTSTGKARYTWLKRMPPLSVWRPA